MPQHALDLFDDRSVLGDLGDLSRDRLLKRRCHIHVEAFGADDQAVVVAQLRGDHHDVM